MSHNENSILVAAEATHIAASLSLVFHSQDALAPPGEKRVERKRETQAIDEEDDENDEEEEEEAEEAEEDEEDDEEDEATMEC